MRLEVDDADVLEVENDDEVALSLKSTSTLWMKLTFSLSSTFTACGCCG